MRIFGLFLMFFRDFTFIIKAICVFCVKLLCVITEYYFKKYDCFFEKKFIFT